jgi:hypothetical protein
MQNLTILFLVLSSVFGGQITECNKCNDTVAVALEDSRYTADYTLCTFDTTLSTTRSIQDGTNWLFLGMQCDDRCDSATVGEGYFCSKEENGYFEVENNILTEKFDKIEFHHLKCNVTDSHISLHMHRFMPNLWLKNTTINYYICSGINDRTLQNILNFSIVY